MATAKKTSAKKSATKKAPAKKMAAKKSGAKTASNKTAHKKSAKKSTKPAEQTSRCWPGFKPVPGKDPGEKGSCEPKAKQTPAEKKADARAAAASKRK
jgi:hypothetical protein